MDEGVGAYRYAMAIDPAAHAVDTSVIGPVTPKASCRRSREESNAKRCRLSHEGRPAVRSAA